MKYITTEQKNGKLEIFTFPDSVNHDCMAEAIRKMRNQTFGNWERVGRIPLSAGFVNASGICLGESESLGLVSRGDKDTSLLRLQN